MTRKHTKKSALALFCLALIGASLCVVPKLSATADDTPQDTVVANVPEDVSGTPDADILPSDEEPVTEDTSVEPVFLLPVNGRISCYFKQDIHNGIDFAAEQGTGIVATADGTVMDCGYNAMNGNYIILAHNESYRSYYMHCSELFVQTGDTVSQGQKIASVGSTGMSTGPHLHFSISFEEEYLNINDDVDRALNNSVNTIELVMGN